MVHTKLEARSPTTLTDKCFRIHLNFAHYGSYVVPPLCSCLPRDGRIRLELRYAPHKCGNRLFHGFVTNGTIGTAGAPC